MGSMCAARSVRLGLMLALVVGGVGESEATVVVGLDKTALIQGADAIIAGRVMRVSAIAGPSGGPEIQTRVLIEVWQKYKDPASLVGAQLQLVQNGGTLGIRTLLIAGQARFRVGEPVLVFVERLTDGRLVPFGMSQGKLSLTDAEGSTVAVRDLSDVALATRTPDGALEIGPASARFPNRFSLAELERDIEALTRPVAPVPAPGKSRHVR